MLRSLVVIAIVFAAASCNTAEAQNRGHRTHPHGHSHAPSHGLSRGWSFGFNDPYGNSGFGYPGYAYTGLGYPDPYRFDGSIGYDPYRYGSFQAPDLMNDPYFKARYKYDSAFPGRSNSSNRRSGR